MFYKLASGNSAVIAELNTLVQERKTQGASQVEMAKEFSVRGPRAHKSALAEAFSRDFFRVDHERQFADSRGKGFTNYVYDFIPHTGMDVHGSLFQYLREKLAPVLSLRELCEQVDKY